jgi:AraC family transcriptional regulator
MSFTIHRVGEAHLCVGDVPRLAPHAPHAFTICVARKGELFVRLGSDSRWQACAAAVIAPDVTHELDGRGTACTLFLEPETHDGRRFAHRTMLFDSAPAWPSTVEPSAVVYTLIEQYAAARFPRLLDPRIQEVLRLIRAAGEGRLTQPQLANAVALSSSRLAHLFHDQTHTTVKRYMLWFRLRSAFAAMNRFTSLTEIAYRVGFADPAHLSRTCRAMLGISPSDLMRLMPVCDENNISVLDDDRSVQFASVLPH